MSASPYLRLTDIHKQFGGFTALRDVSLDITKGEFVCFLGPSGCGKTTLLRIIAGLESQSAGRIEQNGRDISALPPAERDYGIVFQSYALFPNLTVADNVAYGLVNRKLPRAEIRARVAELLKLVGLPGSEGKYPAQLSGGQQQRIALARALATSPGLLLLDEPLSALDAIVRVHLRQEIRGLQRKLGVTTIMVTHDQEEALSVADRIVVMNQGVIEQVGTPMRGLSRPGDTVRRRFRRAHQRAAGHAGSRRARALRRRHVLSVPARRRTGRRGEDLPASRRRAGAPDRARRSERVRRADREDRVPRLVLPGAREEPTCSASTG